MTKYFLLLLTAVVLISCNRKNKDKIAVDHAIQTEQALKATTTVQIIDSSYNFGKVSDGEKVEYNYRFKNIGTNPLVIITADASCGCTLPQKPEKPIMPGEMGFIKIVFDSKGRVGNAYKTITVTSNAKPEFPMLILTGDVMGKEQ
ncbi:MAG: DUF1573 domain-containing protein [Ferruginibacter sp.]